MQDYYIYGHPQLLKRLLFQKAWFFQTNNFTLSLKKYQRLAFLVVENCEFSKTIQGEAIDAHAKSVGAFAFCMAGPSQYLGYESYLAPRFFH